MADKKHGTSEQDEVPEFVSDRWWTNPPAEWSASRRAAQVEAIVRAYEERGIPIGIGPDGDPANMEFLYRTGEVLVRDEDVPRVSRVLGVDSAPIGKAARRGARSSEGQKPAGGVTVIDLPPRDANDVELTTLQWLDRIDDDLGAGIATPNHVVHICPGGGCPASEPLPSAGRPVPAINEDGITSGAGVKVVVLDSGLLEQVRDEHAWLTGVTGDPEPADVGRYRGHGTFIAGIIRAMAPAAEVIVRPLFIVLGTILEDDLAEAMSLALDETPDIISMSAGTTTRSGWPLISMEIFAATRLSRLKGTVLVAAAGNDGNRGPFWPAAFPWSVSVGALDTDGKRAGFSNFGSWVDVYAQGTDVVNAYPRGPFTYSEPPREGQTTNFLTGLANWSGTSFSTPIVAGLIAARMTWSGESARNAADSLLRIARKRTRAVPQPGGLAILEPGDALPR
jgi:subtilisin family serine protease